MHRIDLVGREGLIRRHLSSVAEIANTHFTLFFGLSVIALLVRALLLPDAILMADEYYYAKTAQLWFLHQVDVRSITAIPNQGPVGFPNSLFFAIYRYSFLLGDSFYVVAKMLNVLFTCAAALGVMFVARQYVNRTTASVVALLTLWLPSTTYVPYFMPEPLYECLIWWGLAAFLIRLPRNVPVAFAVLGAFLGAALLVKPTAIAMIAASNVIGVLVCWHGDASTRWRRLAFSLLGLNTAFLIVGYCVNYGVTGHTVWDPVGAFYQSTLASVAKVDAPRAFLRIAADYGFAYCLVIILLFGPALVSLTAAGPMYRESQMDRALIALIVVGLGALLTGSVRVSVAWELLIPNFKGVYSTRYMHVLFPLLIIGFFRWLPAASVLPRRRAQAGFAVAALGAVLAVVYHSMGNLLQMRELTLFGFSRWTTQAAVGGALLSVTMYYAFAARPRGGVFAASLFAYSLMTAGLWLRHDLRTSREEARAPADAARVAEALVPGVARDSGYLVADGSNSATRFMFRYPGTVALKQVPRGSVVPRDSIPGSPDWVAFVGDVRPEFAAACLALQTAFFCPMSAMR